MRFNIKTLLWLLVIFLLGTNVAVIVTYQSHLNSERQTNEEKITIPDAQFGRFFKDELNLNTQQQDSFREFRRKYNRSASQVLTEMQNIRNEMASSLKSTNPDRNELDNLAENLGEKHHELKSLTFDYYFNMQSVLDKTQQEKMVEIFQAMLTEEGNAKTPTQGGQGRGKGRGQGWNRGSDTTQIEN